MTTAEHGSQRAFFDTCQCLPRCGDQMCATDIQVHYVFRVHRLHFFFIFLPAFLVSFQFFVLVFAFTGEFLLFCGDLFAVLLQCLFFDFEQILEAQEEFFHKR